MKLHCALCGRAMDQAAVMIGPLPVGPKCAKRAGLLALAGRRGGMVVPAVRRRARREECPVTMDLFAELAQ